MASAPMHRCIGARNIMLKNIELKLAQIQYGGDSIGDDIRVEIKALGKFLRVDKKAKAKTTAQINQAVGIFETDQKIFKFNTQIVVIEKDLLLNDVGNGNVDIKVDTTIIKPQKFYCKIEIKETRSIFGKIWGNKKAIFEIVLEVSASDAIMCVPMTNDGWFQVVLEKNKKTVSLPSFLQIKLSGIAKGRENIMILEGAYRGEKASTKLSSNGASYFVSVVKYEPIALAKYSISRKIFTLNEKEYKATDHPETPWEKGVYDIEIPSAPKRLGERYLNKARLAKVWFLIGHNGERFLHPGMVSRGCMTINEVEKWDILCEKLLKCRKDYQSVGVVEVID